MFKKVKIVKNHNFEKAILQNRIMILFIIILFIIMALVSRLLYLQVSQYDNFTNKAYKNQFRLVATPPKRGIIYDRNQVVLANNIPSHKLELKLDNISNISEYTNVLSNKIGEQSFNIDLSSIRKTGVITLKSTLSEKQIATFHINKYLFPEASINSYVIREYPFGSTSAAILGYIAKNTEPLADTEENFIYQINPLKGKVGLEASYEKVLRGVPGYKKITTNAQGKKISSTIIKEAVAGSDIVLTIDIKLQQAAQIALQQESGAVVVINPQNGEILALASNPSYDPNIFIQGLDNNAINKVASATSKPMFNRATKGQFALASTIKPFLIIDAIDKKIINPLDRIIDKGYYIHPNTTHVYRDWKLDGHGSVNAIDAIKISCDTYFYQLAIKMGIDNISDILDKFGFGHKTELDIDGEAGGLVASRLWKETTKGISWYIGDTILSSIGQGFMLTTPLQLAQATATLANKGIGYRPHLVKQIINENKAIVSTDKIALAPITISDYAYKTVVKAMEKVVGEPGGTGFKFGYQHDYTIAAKTGTAQLYRNENNVPEDQVAKKLRTNSLFIGFSPVKNPEIAIAVIVENSSIASNVARKVVDEYYYNKSRRVNEKH